MQKYAENFNQNVLPLSLSLGLFSYVHGIGSETRNSLFHLHNGRDMVMVTTCRHGKSWRELQDNRCDEDNREYDR